MSFNDDDLNEMLIDCVSDIKRLNYELFPILSIKFTKGSKKSMAYIRRDKNCSYNLDTMRFENVAYHIRVHGMFKQLQENDYNDLKSVVMHEVIHAIDLSKISDKYWFPALLHGSKYNEIKNEVEQTYGYKHIHDTSMETNELNKMDIFFKNYYESRGIKFQKGVLRNII